MRTLTEMREKLVRRAETLTKLRAMDPLPTFEVNPFGTSMKSLRFFGVIVKMLLLPDRWSSANCFADKFKSQLAPPFFFSAKLHVGKEKIKLQFPRSVLRSSPPGEPTAKEHPTPVVWVACLIILGTTDQMLTGIKWPKMN